MESEMSDSTAVAGYSLDSILDMLDQFHQRATYGAVAAMVDTSPRSLMTGRDRNPRSSWVVSRQSGQPTGYTEEQIHGDLTERATVLSTPEALRAWLEDPA